MTPKSPVLILGFFWGSFLPSSEFCHKLAKNPCWVFFFPLKISCREHRVQIHMCCKNSLRLYCIDGTIHPTAASSRGSPARPTCVWEIYAEEAVRECNWTKNPQEGNKSQLKTAQLALKKRQSSTYFYLFLNLPVSNTGEGHYLVETVRKEVVCTSWI